MSSLGSRPASRNWAGAFRSIPITRSAGSLATTKKGAIPAMPGEAEILDCIRTVPKLQVQKPAVK